MSEKHTPGPWAYLAATRTVVDAEGRSIATVSVDTANAGRNGKVIAAAPELLEALQELVTLVDDFLAGEYTPDSFTTQPACAAIAKATGASHG